MDLIQNQKSVLNWLATADTRSRCDFVKVALGMLNENELKRCLSKVSKCRKKLKRGLPKTLVSSVPSRSARDGPGLAKLSKDESVKSMTLPEEVPSSAKSLRSAREAESQTISKPKDIPWWHSYRPANVVALDCEHVHYQGLKSIQRIKAATVTIVNFKSEVIYHAKVFHEPGSFMVNAYTKKVTGFTRDSFVDGRPLEEISEEVASLLEDKLVIVHNGATDFSSLDLLMGDFNVFDLTCHFQKDNGQRSKYEEIIYQPINLGSIYKHYFGENIQGGVHTCEEDAKATMRVFLGPYRRTKASDCTNRQTHCFDQFQDIVNVKK